MSSISVGDRVSWQTSQGRTSGRVVEKKTSDFEFAGQHFAATSEDPAFVVESKATGARAAHRGRALRSLRSNDA